MNTLILENNKAVWLRSYWENFGKIVFTIFLSFRFEFKTEAMAETEAEEAYESAPEYKTEIKIQITLSEDGIKIRIKLMIGKQSLISNF